MKAESHLKYKSRTCLQFGDLQFNVIKEDYEQLQKSHIDTIRKYDELNSAKGRSEDTRYNRIQFLMLFAREMQKPFNQVIKDDITKFLNRDISIGTKNSYVTMLKHFYGWMKKPKLMEDFEIKQAPKKLQPRDLWAESEVKRLIEVAYHPRDKCAVAMLFDLSIERKCIYNLNVGDINITDAGIIVTVEGKRRGSRQTRQLKCVTSAPYVRDWMDNHPMKNDKTAPFFISFSGNSFGQRCSYNWCYDLLKQLAKQAGIDKPVRPHLIRHSSLTMLYRLGFTGVPFQKHAGWSNGNMEQTYVDLTPEEIYNEREAKMKGIEWKPEQHEPSELIQIECTRCHAMNTATSQYCKQCYMPLSQKTASKELMILELIRSKLYEDEKQIAKETGEHQDIEVLAEKYAQLIREQNVPGRKQVLKH